MSAVEDRPAFQRPHMQKFGIPTPRKLTPDVHQWVFTSPAALATFLATTGVPLHPTYAAQLIRVRAGLKTAGSTATTGTLKVSGVVVATFTIPASSRLGYPVRPSVAARWRDTDYLEVNLTAVGTGAGGPLTLILDHIRSEL